MPEASSIDAWKRSLNERFKELLVQLEAVRDAIAINGHQDGLKPLMEKLSITLRDLHSGLADEDRPGWLKEIYKRASDYATHFAAPQAKLFLTALTRNWRDIKEVRFSDSVPELINFDDLFSTCRDEQRLPELFDKLIGIIHQIIESDELDSVSIRNAFLELINLLRTNRNGSFTAILNTICTAAFVKNLCRSALAEVPGLKNLLEAFEQTQEEMQVKLARADEQTRNATIRILVEKIPRLEKLDQFKVIAAEFEAPLALPPPAAKDADE